MGLVYVVAIGAVGFALWRSLVAAPPDERKRNLQRLIWYAVTALVFALAFRGGSYWLLALLAAAWVGIRVLPAWTKSRRKR